MAIKIKEIQVKTTIERSAINATISEEKIKEIKQEIIKELKQLITQEQRKRKNR